MIDASTLATIREDIEMLREALDPGQPPQQLAEAAWTLVKWLPVLQAAEDALAGREPEPAAGRAGGDTEKGGPRTALPGMSCETAYCGSWSSTPST